MTQTTSEKMPKFKIKLFDKYFHLIIQCFKTICNALVMKIEFFEMRIFFMKNIIIEEVKSNF